MEAITLTFSAQKLDYIANVLAQRPFSEVQDLMTDIRQQIAEQQRPKVVPLPTIPPAGDEAA